MRFAFVSCQNANQGAQNAYRRMIYEDERAAEEDRLGFVLHLGDFIYEIVWYPEDRPQGMYDRRLRDIVRYPHGEKIRDFHIPTNVDDYRAVYRAYLHDPDLQDARARWPFVNMWDNHEFSWLGWQGLQKFEGKTRPAQTRKVAANQAFFEYQPARMFETERPVARALRCRRTWSMRRSRISTSTAWAGAEQSGRDRTASGLSRDALGPQRRADHHRPAQLSLGRADGSAGSQRRFPSDDFPEFIPEEAMEILDAGRAYNGGNPPATIRYGERRDSELPQRRPAANDSRRGTEGLVS